MKKLDKFFSEKLTEHSITPSMAAWEKVEARLTKKNNTWLWLRWAAVFLLGVLVLGSVLIRQNEISGKLAVKEKINHPKKGLEKKEAVKEQKLLSENVVPKKKAKTKTKNQVQTHTIKTSVINNKETLAQATIEQETSSAIQEAETSASIKNSTNENIVVNKSIILIYTLDTVELTVKAPSAIVASNDKRESSLKKVARFASEVKNGNSPLSGLRMMKEDLFALDLKKKTTGKKQ